MAAFLSNMSAALPAALWAGRVLLLLAAVWVLLRCGLSLFGQREEPEVWGFISLSNGARYDLTHWENMIGRMRSADVRVNFPSVSRCHAALCRNDQGQWTVYPVNHSSGVLLNGERKLESAPVKAGDCIAVGGVELYFFPSTETDEAKVARRRAREQKRRRLSPVGTLLTLILTVLAAYAFTIYEFRGKTVFFFLCLATMMVPSELLIIQNFITISRLHWVNTFQGMIIPTLASGFYIYMMREYFMQVPSVLYRAAKVDGCGDLRYLLRVMIPMNKNAIATIGILTFISQWNSFIWPLMVSKDDAHRVMAIGLLHFRDAVSSQVNLQMAGATIVLLPMLLFYLAFHKQIIEGVSRGGIKG